MYCMNQNTQQRYNQVLVHQLAQLPGNQGDIEVSDFSFLSFQIFSYHLSIRLF